MRRIVFFFLSFFFCLALNAQNEFGMDSIQHNDRDIPFILGSDVRNYNGFLLDLGNIAPAPVKLDNISYSSMINSLPAYNKSAIALPKDVKYSTATLNGTTQWGLGVFGLGTFNSASFKLKNGIILSTYGDYDSQGNRTRFAPLPWQQHDFRGAFELKSSDKKFSFRMEFHRGNTWGY